jgi:hypothetical protein
VVQNGDTGYSPDMAHATFYIVNTIIQITAQDSIDFHRIVRT